MTTEHALLPLPEIEALILYHKQTLRELRTQRNKHTISYRLPAELLARVFFLYIDLTLVEIDSHPRWHFKPEHPVPWVSISHVSQYWRDVALECPDLWCIFLLNSPEGWTTELLRRSKDAILSVRIDPRQSLIKRPSVVLSPLIDAVAAKINSHGNRLGLLEIPLDNSGGLPNKLAVLLSVSTPPALKHVSLIRTSLEARHEEGTDAAGSAVLRTFIWKEGHGLRSLHVDGFKGRSWIKNPGNCLTLRVLTISNCSNLVLKDLLKILRGLGGLEELVLKTCLSYTRRDWDVDISLSLPSLRRLSILGADIEAISSFMELVAIPQEAQIFFDCWATPLTRASWELLERFFHAMFRYLTSSSNVSFVHSLFRDRLFLAFSRKTHIHYNQPRSKDDGSNASPGRNFPENADIVVAFPHFSNYGRRANDVILKQTLPTLEHVEHAFLEFGDQGEPLHGWIEALGSFEGLRDMEVKLTKLAQERFFRVLDPDTTDRPPNINMKFGSLSSLTLWTAILPLDKEPTASAQASGHTSLRHSLLSILAERRARGHPLHSLTLRETPNIKGSTLEKLKEVVENEEVHWDADTEQWSRT